MTAAEEFTVARRGGTAPVFAQPDVPDPVDTDVPAPATDQDDVVDAEPAGVTGRRVRAWRLGSATVDAGRAGGGVAAFAATAAALGAGVAGVWAATVVWAVVAAGLSVWVWRVGRAVRWTPVSTDASRLRTGMWVDHDGLLVVVRAVRKSATAVAFTTSDHVRSEVSIYGQIRVAHIWWPVGTGGDVRAHIEGASPAHP